MLTSPFFAKAEYETPPYDIKIFPIDENFREAYYAIDRLRLVTSPLTYVSESGTNRLCIDSPTLCVDALNNRVGIGTASPSFKLHVISADSLASTFDSTSARGAIVSFKQNNTTRGYIGVSGAWEGNTSSALAIPSESEIRFYTNGTATVKWKADGDGAITQPLQPSFSAYLNGTETNVTGDATSYTVPFNAEVRDAGGDFNTATGVFTAPVDGCYSFNTSIRFAEIDSSHELLIVTILTTNYNYQIIEPVNDAKTTIQVANLSVSCAEMDTNDTASVSVIVETGNKVVDITGNSTAANIRTWFTGSLIN